MYAHEGEVPDERYHAFPSGKGDVKRGRDGCDTRWHGRRWFHVTLRGRRRNWRRTASRWRLLTSRTIRPLDEELILKSVKKTNRCVIVEEGWPFAGAGSEDRVSGDK